MGVGIVDDLLTLDTHIPVLGKNVDGVLDAAYARLEHFVHSFISLLIFCLDALQVLGTQERIQYFGVVPNPPSAASESQQADHGGCLPFWSQPQSGVAEARSCSVWLSPWPDHHRGDGEEQAEKQPIEREPVPRLAIRGVAEEIGIDNLGPSRKLNKVGCDVQCRPNISVDAIKENEG